MIQKHLSNNVRAERARLGLTQEQLAKKVGVARKTINVIEAGNYAPSVTLALTIAEALGKPIHEVFFLTEE